MKKIVWMTIALSGVGITVHAQTSVKDSMRVVNLQEVQVVSTPASELEARIADVKERMLAAGASYVIRTIEELPALIETINAGN